MEIRKIYRLIIACSLLFPNVLRAQWYDFDPIVLRKDIEPGWFLIPRVQINDFGDALYMMRFSSVVGSRIFVNDKLVHEGGSVSMIGDINDDGQFSFTESNEIYLGRAETGVSRVADCCEFITRYIGVGGDVITAPRIDGRGRPYFMASTEEQLKPNIESYLGEANIYVAEDVEATLVLDSVLVNEGSHPIEFANVSWDVNEIGELAIGGLLIGPDESLDLEIALALDHRRQLSLNNHGEFTRHWAIVDEQGIDQPAIAIFGEQFTVVPTHGTTPQIAIINDHRTIAFSSSDVTDRGIYLLDAITEDIAEVMIHEDRGPELTYFWLHDYNDAGQLAIETSAGFFLVTPQNEPSGDLDFDGGTDAGDIDKLATAIRDGSARTLFDLNQDGRVATGDFDFWVMELAHTFHGDANLDGKVGFADFLTLSANFETNGGWSDGDFNGSGKHSLRCLSPSPASNRPSLRDGARVVPGMIAAIQTDSWRTPALASSHQARGLGRHKA